MEVRKKRISHRYLLRFVGTLTLALLIPIILFFFIVVNMSYQQMTQSTNDLYMDITDSFYVYFENELASMRTQSLELSVKSADREMATFSQEQLQANPYHYLRVVEYLSKMTSPFKSYDLFLYYGDLDFVYSSQFKYNLDEFLDRESGRSRETRLQLESFFNGTGTDQRLCSTFDEASLNSAALYVGTPITLGPGGSPGLLVYKLRHDAVNAGMFSTQSTHALSLCVASEAGELLFTNSPALQRELSGDELQKTLIQENSTALLTLGGEPYTLFYASSFPEAERRYITALPRDSVEKEIFSFYMVILRGTVLILALLVTLLCVTVYINYAPIQRLVKRVGSSSAEGELRSIENALDRMESELMEKDLLVMNFLITNLLYGVPIPADEVARHGLEDHQGGVCVMTLPGVVFDNLTRERLTAEAAEQLETNVFITDMLYENYTVIICLLGHAKQAPLRNYLQGFAGGSPIYVGEVFENLNEIQKSYKDCLRQMKQGTQKATPDKTGEIQRRLKEDIVSYIDLHFTNPQLNQPIVSDHFGLSIYSLSRFFKEHMESGFSEYITDKRIAYAKELLLTTDKNVSAIAEAVGITNTNYFSRLFKTRCGVSPLGYRERMESS